MTKEDWNKMIDNAKIRYDEIELSLLQQTTDKEVKELVKEIYDMGFEHGQQYVWFARSGFGMTDEE